VRFKNFTERPHALGKFDHVRKGDSQPSLMGKRACVGNPPKPSYTGFAVGAAEATGPGGNDGNGNPSGGQGAAGAANAIQQF
jgi:hypothetical protein